jgi:hypothetical protein
MSWLLGGCIRTARSLSRPGGEALLLECGDLTPLYAFVVAGLKSVLFLLPVDGLPRHQ